MSVTASLIEAGQDTSPNKDSGVAVGDGRRGPEHSLNMFLDTISGERLQQKEFSSWRSLLSDFVASSIALENLLSAVPPRYEASALTPGWIPMDLQTSSAVPTSLTLIPDPQLAEQHRALFALYAINDNASRQQLIQQNYVGEGGKVCENPELIESLVNSNPLTNLVKDEKHKPSVTLTKESYLQKRTAFHNLNNFIDSELMTILNEASSNTEAELVPDDIPPPYFRGVGPEMIQRDKDKAELLYTNKWRDYSDQQIPLSKRLEEHGKLTRELIEIYGGTTRALQKNT